jgi:hypothetical protein
MSARRQGNLILVGLAIILVVLMAVGYMKHSHSLDRGYQQIKDGDTEERVLALMGKPNRVVLPGDRRFWSSSVLPYARPGDRTKISECVTEYHYEVRIWPELWIVGFNAQGKVVCRHHKVA